MTHYHVTLCITTTHPAQCTVSLTPLRQLGPRQSSSGTARMLWWDRRGYKEGFIQIVAGTKRRAGSKNTGCVESMSMRREDEMPYQDDNLLLVVGMSFSLLQFSKRLIHPGKSTQLHQPTAENSGLGPTASKYGEWVSFIC